MSSKLSATAWLCGLSVLGWSALAQAGPNKSDQHPLRLTSQKQDQPVVKKETTTVTTTTTTAQVKRESWEIEGPVNLRSADPEEPGELIMKHIFEWETNKHTIDPGDDDGEDDNSEYFYEFELEYGLVENHELIFAMPFELGDGNEQGNGDIELGWHWRLWEEGDDWMPAFAIRNFLFLGTGHDSDGVDWTLKGLFTKTITPGCTRFHVNPWLTVVDTDDEDDDDEWLPIFVTLADDEEQGDERDFRWGVTVGIDHWLQDDLLLIADYNYFNSEHEGYRDQHTAELGLDWHFAPCQILSVATEVSLDGDSEGPCFAAKVSYMYEFGGE